MGIDKNRFLGDHHQVFLCPVCKDVSEEPILSSCCESTFCNTCWTKHMSKPLDKCPTCGRLNDPYIVTKLFQKQLMQVYKNLSMKCTERACGETVTVSTYKEHDNSCLLKKFHCYKCGFKGKMMDSTDHDCVRWLKQERNQLQEKVTNLTVKLKLAQINGPVPSATMNVVHDEEVDRVIKENIELKERLQELSKENQQVIKEKKHLQDTLNSMGKMLSSSMPESQGSKVQYSLVNGHREVKSDDLRTEPSTSHCFLVTTSGPPASLTPPFQSSLPTITLAKECDLTKESKVVFVEQATRAGKEIKAMVSRVFVEVFKSNANQGLNIQRKCLEVSKEMKNLATGTWYTFPKNHFNPQGFRPFLNTFCLFSFEGKYYVAFQNNGPVEEKSRFLNHYLRFK